MEGPGTSLGTMQPPSFDFSAAMKELEEEGPTVYTQKHGLPGEKDATPQEGDVNMQPSLKKKK